MTVLVRSVALLLGFAALARALVRVRRPATFPLGTLMRTWFAPRPSARLVRLGVIAGAASVIGGPLVELAAGRATMVAPASIEARWVLLAIAGVFVKAAFGVFEEIVFRGALVSELRRVLPQWIAIAAAALLFAAAHAPRPPIDLAVLAIDGVGFGVAFVATGTLWLPAVWHFSKNLAVWLVFGSGTIDITHGPFSLRYRENSMPASSAATPLDLAAALLVVAAVVFTLRRTQRRA